jgi:hypothetical protein
MENPCNKQDMELFYVFTSVSIGNGYKPSFWEDSWADGISPKVLAPSIFAISRQKSWSVYMAITNDAWVRQLDISAGLSVQQLQELPTYGDTPPDSPYMTTLWTLLLGSSHIADFCLRTQYNTDAHKHARTHTLPL